MSAFKVDTAFLSGPIPGVIKNCTRIAKMLTKNPNFPIPPVSPAGLQIAVDHLKQMQSRVKENNIKSKTSRDEALADINDYILQLAEYVNHVSYYDMEKLLSSGFSVHNEEKTGTPPPATATQLSLRNGKKPGEIIASIEPVSRCKVVIGRVSSDRGFPEEQTNEVVGSSSMRVAFSQLQSGAEVWIAVKCRGTNGDGSWSKAQSITVR